MLMYEYEIMLKYFQSDEEYVPDEISSSQLRLVTTILDYIATAIINCTLYLPTIFFPPRFTTRLMIRPKRGKN